MRLRSGTRYRCAHKRHKIRKLIELIRIEVLLGRERQGTNTNTLKEPDIVSRRLSEISARCLVSEFYLKIHNRNAGVRIQRLVLRKDLIF